MSKRTLLLTVSIVSALLATSSCVLPTPAAANETRPYPAFGLEDAQPADIAVVPVRDESETGGAPVGTLRRELYLGLVERLYSPLDLDYVDVHWVEAGFETAGLEAGGVLQVVIQDWDTSLLPTHGALLVSFQAEILDGRRPGAEALWGVQAKRRMELANEQVNLSGSALFERAGEILAGEILEMIPVREVQASSTPSE